MRQDHHCRSLWPVLRGRLYFFPAVLPLVEIVPWLLTAIGAAAGAAGLFQGKHRNKTLFAALVFFLAAGVVVYTALPGKAVRHEGTRAIPEVEFPIPVVHNVISPEKPLMLGSFGELWSQSVQKQILASPVIAAGYMVLGTYDGHVEAYSLKNGTLVWSLALKNPVFSIGAGKEGLIYIGEGLHHTQVAALTVVDASNGKILWQREFLGHLEEHPAISPDGEMLWLGAGPGGLWALEAHDGNVLWHRKIGHMDSTPLFLDGVLYAQAQQEDVQVGTKRFEDKSFLYALNADDGINIWHSSLPGQPWGEPVAHVDGEILLTTSGQGQIGVQKNTDRGWAQGVALLDGKVNWQVELPGMPVQPGIYVPQSDMLILTVKGGDIIALHGKDGAVAWRARIGTEFQTAASPVIVGGEMLVAAATYDGQLSILRGADGAVLAKRSIPKGTTSSPVIADNALYVTTPYKITAFGGIHALIEEK